jgi:hypothetical protein
MCRYNSGVGGFVNAATWSAMGGARAGPVIIVEAAPFETTALSRSHTDTEDDPRWSSELAEFRVLLESHIRQEANGVFPRIGEQLESNEEKSLSIAMNKDGSSSLGYDASYGQAGLRLGAAFPTRQPASRLDQISAHADGVAGRVAQAPPQLTATSHCKQKNSL